MDSHVATQCRRAKRSKSNILDLSCLGLPRWNPDIFGLVDLETLKLNDNCLTEVPVDLSKLEKLTTLDLSNNKLEKLPSIDFDALKNLSSVNLEGNPCVAKLSSTTVKKMLHPEKISGKTPAQCLRDLFVSPNDNTSGVAAVPKMSSDVAFGLGATKPFTPYPSEPKMADRSKPFTPAPAEAKKESKSLDDYMKDLGGSDDEYSDDFEEDDAPKPVKPPAPPVAAVKGGAPVVAFKKPAHDSDSDDHKPSRPAVGRRTASGLQHAAPVAPPRAEASTASSRQTADAEVEKLKAELKKLRVELHETKEAKEKAEMAALRPSEASRESSRKVDLASTLPSRLHAMDENLGADKLKQQLQDEQRKVKRLERENQKLSDRMRESTMSASSASAPHVELSEIQEGEILSKSGGFSLIHHGTLHGTKVAIKKLFDPSNNPENLAELDNEVDKLGRLRHPNIVTLLAVHRRPPVYSIVMEVLTGGSMFTLLHDKRSFNFAPEKASYTAQDMLRIDESVGLALTFMHARNIAHRDVKSHNVLLSPHLEAKLCDFGLARMKSELMTGAMQFGGTPNYMAPELFRKQKYTEKVDVWAFGILAWESFADDIPFPNLDPPEIADCVMTGKMPSIPMSAPRPIQQAIKGCWTIDSNARLPMADALELVRSCRS